MEKKEFRSSNENLDYKNVESGIGNIYAPPMTAVKSSERELYTGTKVMNIILMLLGLLYLIMTLAISQGYTQSKIYTVLQLSLSLLVIGSGLIPYLSIKEDSSHKNKVFGIVLNIISLIVVLAILGFFVSLSGINIYLTIIVAFVIPFVVNIRYFCGI